MSDRVVIAPPRSLKGMKAPENDQRTTSPQMSPSPPTECRSDFARNGQYVDVRKNDAFNS